MSDDREFAEVLSVAEGCAESDRLENELRAAWQRITEAASLEFSPELASEVLAELQEAFDDRLSGNLEIAESGPRKDDNF